MFSVNVVSTFPSPLLPTSPHPTETQKLGSWRSKRGDQISTASKHQAVCVKRNFSLHLSGKRRVEVSSVETHTTWSSLSPVLAKWPRRRCWCQKADGCLEGTGSRKGHTEQRAGLVLLVEMTGKRNSGSLRRGNVLPERLSTGATWPSLGVAAGSPRPVAGPALQKQHSVGPATARDAGKPVLLRAAAASLHPPAERPALPPPRGHDPTAWTLLTPQAPHRYSTACGASPASHAPSLPGRTRATPASWAHACPTDCLSQCLSID